MKISLILAFLLIIGLLFSGCTKQQSEPVQLNNSVQVNVLNQSTQFKSDNVSSILKMSPEAAVLYKNGKEYSSKGNYRKAINEYEIALDIDPSNPVLFYESGRSYESLKQYDMALELYNQGLKFSQDNPDLWERKGIVLEALNLSGYVDAYKKAVSINKSMTYSWFRIGIFEMDGKDYRNASAAFGIVIMNEPENAQGYLEKGLATLELGDVNESVAILKKAVSLKPNDPLYLKNFGRSLLLEGNLAEALKNYDLALKYVTSKEEEGEVLYLKSIALDMTGDKEGAYASIVNATTLNSSDLNSWYERAELASITGRKNDAILSYNEVSKISPQDPKSWYRRGVLLQDVGDYTGAIQAFDNVISIDPSIGKAWYRKGMILNSLGKYDEARVCFDRSQSSKNQEEL